MNSPLAILCLLAASTSALLGQNLTVSLAQDSTHEYSNSDPVTVSISDAVDNQVTVESDFASQSISGNLSPGGTNLDIGTVSGVGEFVVRFATDTPPPLLVTYLVLPSGDQGTKFTIQEEQVKGKALDGSLLKRFKGAMTKDRIHNAVHAAINPWLANHSVDVGTTVVVCIVAPATAEIGVGFVVCGKNVAGLGADFAQTVGDEILKGMVKDQTITEDESSILSEWLHDGNFVAKLALGESDADRVWAAVGNAVDETLQDGSSTKVLVDTGMSGVQKYVWAYSKLKGQ